MNKKENYKLFHNIKKECPDSKVKVDVDIIEKLRSDKNDLNLFNSKYINQLKNQIKLEV